VPPPPLGSSAPWGGKRLNGRACCGNPAVLACHSGSGHARQSSRHSGECRTARGGMCHSCLAAACAMLLTRWPTFAAWTQRSQQCPSRHGLAVGKASQQHSPGQPMRAGGTQPPRAAGTNLLFGSAPSQWRGKAEPRRSWLGGVAGGTAPCAVQTHGGRCCVSSAGLLVDSAAAAALFTRRSSAGPC
jgi:hypothetical protein